MSRKIKILLLVVAMLFVGCRYSYAGILTDIELRYDADTETVMVVSLNIVASPYYFGIENPLSGDAIIGDPLSVYAAAGNTAEIIPIPSGSSDWGWVGVLCKVREDTPGTIAIGDWFSFGYTPDGAVGDVLNIYDFDVSTTEPVGTLALTAIPEPATIGLLGLGGLFFVRKRR